MGAVVAAVGAISQSDVHWPCNEREEEVEGGRTWWRWREGEGEGEGEGGGGGGGGGRGMLVLV